jgi:uncharacterized protein (DUF58 family)
MTIGFLGLLVAFFTVVIVDALFAFRGLDGVSVRLPDVVRLGKDREGEILLQLGNPSQKPIEISVGLPFPPEIIPETESLPAILPAESPAALLRWLCTPLKRGKYMINRCYLETPSPLGLWNYRKSFPCESELRVYPNLSDERKKLAAIFLNRGASGIHTQRLVGREGV